MIKKIQEIWEPNSSGILLPAGYITDRQDRFKTTTYLDVTSKAEKIEEIYSTNGLTLSDNSDLAKLINNAAEFWERWFANETDKLEMRMLFNLLHLDRIADMVLTLKEEPKAVEYLKALISGPLDFFQRQQSNAMDIFWELELWSKLKKRLDTAHLEEPPDIVIEFEDSKIGIACKKLYSERHVQNVLSQAVGQIEDSFEIGIVAINLDDLTPPDSVLKASNAADMTQILLNFNAEFIQRHERHFRKYLASGRLISVIVSTEVIADIADAKPQFNNVSQWTIWTIQGLEQKKDQNLRRFYDVVMG